MLNYFFSWETLGTGSSTRKAPEYFFNSFKDLGSSYMLSVLWVQNFYISDTDCMFQEVYHESTKAVSSAKGEFLNNEGEAAKRD